MADGQSKWTLDLDVTAFTEGVMKAKGQLEEIGGEENLAGLTSKLMEAGALLGVIGAAALAVKSAFDVTFDSEQINNINSQFNLLATNAGLAADVIKDKLVTAAGGLAGETEILKAANTEFTRLGANAGKLPEIMELARKDTIAFGGDLVSNFQKITEAIARGNSRQLQSIGITLDQTKVYEQYAQKIGTVAGALSKEEKQRATLEAVLSKGNDALRGMDESTLAATNSWKQFTVQMGELKEMVTKALGDTLAPLVKRIADNMNVLAGAAKDFFKDHFGSPAEQAAHRIQGMDEELNKLHNHLSEVKAAQADGWWGKFWNGGPQEIVRTQKALDELTRQRDAALKAAPQAARGPASEGGDDKAAQQDNQKRLQQQLKFNQDLLKVKMQGLDAELAASSAYTDKDGNIRYRGEEIINEKIKVLHEQTKNETAQIQNSVELTEQQKSLKIIEINRKEAQEKMKLEHEVKAVREKNLQQYLKDSNSTAQGIQRGFQVGGQEAIKNMNDFGARGAAAFNAVNSHAKSFFVALGEGSKSGAQLMKGFFFGVLGDMAEQQGSFLLAAGIGTYNPVQVAEGGALLALSGYLHSQANGGSSGGGGGSSGGGGGSVGAASAPPPQTSSAPTPQASAAKTLSINIAGNYMETDQTRNRMMQIIREAGDFTNFNLLKIGQS